MSNQYEDNPIGIPEKTLRPQKPPNLKPDLSIWLANIWDKPKLIYRPDHPSWKPTTQHTPHEMTIYTNRHQLHIVTSITPAIDIGVKPTEYLIYPNPQITECVMLMTLRAHLQIQKPPRGPLSGHP